MLFSIEFDVTVFDVPVFDVTLLYPFYPLSLFKPLCQCTNEIAYQERGKILVRELVIGNFRFRFWFRLKFGFEPKPKFRHIVEFPYGPKF